MKSEARSTVYVTRDVVSIPSAVMYLKRDMTVEFVNEEKGIRRILVDEDGRIRSFPGVEFTPALIREWGKGEIEPRIRYEAVFSVEGDGILMRWTLRPDGRYWEDDWGFGAEDYKSLELAAKIDAEGNFTAPFRLYAIGDREVREDGA